MMSGMASDAEPRELTPDELARVQTAIDAGTIWATVDGGRFAMRLIDAKKCKLAPGVVSMWPGDDDRYEPLYSRDELNRRVDALIKELPRTAKAVKRAEAEVAFLQKHHAELVGINTEAILNSGAISPLLPALLFGGLAALILWLLGVSPLFGVAVGVVAYIAQQRRGERLRLETQARVNALRATEGLPPRDEAREPEPK